MFTVTTSRRKKARFAGLPATVRYTQKNHYYSVASIKYLKAQFASLVFCLFHLWMWIGSFLLIQTCEKSKREDSSYIFLNSLASSLSMYGIVVGRKLGSIYIPSSFSTPTEPVVFRRPLY